MILTNLISVLDDHVPISLFFSAIIAMYGGWQNSAVDITFIMLYKCSVIWFTIAD